MMRFLVSLPLLLLGGLSLHAEEALPLEAAWPGKQFVPPGVKLTLKLPAQVVIGHEIPAALVVRNEGTQSFTVSVGGDYRSTGYPQRMKVRVRDAAGSLLPELSRESYGFGGGGIGFEPRIEPGGQHEVEFPLDCYVSFPQAGDYTVTSGHDLGWKLDALHPHPVAQAVLKVRMPTAVEAAAHVGALFASQPTPKPRNESAALQQQWNLEKSLSVLRHPVYLPALIRHAQAGYTAAVKGIGHIATPEATEALLALLDHASTEVVQTSVQQIHRRLPLQQADGKLLPGFYWGSSYQIEPLLPAAWEERFEKPLLQSGLRLLEHESAEVVQLAAHVLKSRGTAVHALELLALLQKSLDASHPVQSGPKANTLDLPVPQCALIEALDGLRSRGWRLDERGGGTAYLVAWFRQLSDTTVPKPEGDDWKRSMLTWVENGPKALKIAALEALPQPLEDAAVKPVLKALEDEDLGVMRVACVVAGKSQRPEFATPLVQIIETCHESFLQRAARDAAQACGARLKLWEALASTIIDKDRMCDAVRQLVLGTIDLPPSNGSSGNSNFTREQSFAIRDAWRTFLQKHRDELAAGKKVPPPGAVAAAALTGGNFDKNSPVTRIDFKDGTCWPTRRGR